MPALHLINNESTYIRMLYVGVVATTYYIITCVCAQKPYIVNDKLHGAPMHAASCAHILLYIFYSVMMLLEYKTQQQ